MTRFAVEVRSHRGFRAGVDGETDLPGFAVVDRVGDVEVEWGFDSEQDRIVRLAARLNAMASVVPCKVCGRVVTAKDPERFPYCKSCFYTGRSAEDVRSAQLAEMNALLPDGWVAGVEHTGGGCFWLAIRHEDSPVYYVLTDGEASLPTGDDHKPVRGGWGYVGRYSDDEDSPDYEGADPFYFSLDALGDPAAGLSDGAALRFVLDDIAARGGTDVGLRSGADARAHGRVAEYADVTKRRLLASGQSEEQAEAARQEIIDRFSSEAR